MTRFRLVVIGICIGALAATAAATASQTSHAKQSKREAVSGSVSIIGIWTGPEQKRFQAVLDGFQKLYPNVKVEVHVGRRQHPDDPGDGDPGRQPTRPRIDRPARAASRLREPGRHQADPVRAGDRRTELHADWIKLGTVKGKLYGLFFKGANKSTVWYSTSAFKAAGAKPPKTWPALLSAANTIRASGTPAFSIGAADGWT